MGLIGFIVSLVAGLFMLVGLLPFLGWLNWITTLPVAFAGVIISGIGMAESRRGFAIAGLSISLVVFIIGLGRLAVGCGVF